MQKNIIMFFLLTAINLSGQQSWKWQNPLPQGKAINEISIVDSNNIFAAGDNGLILKTTGGGTNWNIIETGYTNNLKTLYFTDNLNGCAGGDNGIIIRTTDGGLNFTRQDTGGVTFNINSIIFTSADRGYAATSNGILLGTTNGGSSWSQIISFPQSSFSKIYFVNSQTGWLTGGNGILKKTTDGGTTWNDQNSGLSSILSSISFTDPDNGWICGQSGIIIKTTDGGNSWSKINSTTTNWLLSISFSDQNTGITVGKNGVILRTTDSGSNWGKEVHDSTLTFNYISILNSGNGWLAGNSGFLAKSDDAGLTWDFKSSGDRVNMNSIYFISSSMGFIAGDKGTIYKTTDNGNTWIKKVSNTNVNLNDISYYNHYSKKEVWIVGDKATVLRSGDLGETWSIADYHKTTNSNLTSVDAEGTINNYIGCDNGDLLTINIAAGYRVHLDKALTKGTIKNIYTTRPSSIFIVGGAEPSGAGTYLFIHIGGSAGNGGAGGGPTTISNIFSDLNQVTFYKKLGSMYSDKYGLIVGRYGVLLKSTNEGKIWTKSTIDITEGKGICFADTANVFICGTNGEILKSTDKGNSWTKLTTHLRTTLSKIYFQDLQTGWVVGPNGLIMKTENGGGPTATGIKDDIIESLNSFSLSQNYPNPFNPETKIYYKISESCKVSIKVYNILGKEVSTLMNENKDPGTYNISFNGNGLSSGIYFYRLQAGSYSETRKMVLLK